MFRTERPTFDVFSPGRMKRKVWVALQETGTRYTGKVHDWHYQLFQGLSALLVLLFLLRQRSRSYVEGSTDAVSRTVDVIERWWHSCHCLFLAIILLTLAYVGVTNLIARSILIALAVLAVVVAVYTRKISR